MSNKPRVFVAAYFRQGITQDPQSVQLGTARFHWAIWIEPKGSMGPGACYQVYSEDTYRNVPGSGGWNYNYRPTADYTRSGSMIGRLMIGKLPPGVTCDDVDAVLSRLPLPRENVHPIENCVTWTMAAIEQLQARGWADMFDIRTFMDWALRTVTEWYRSKGGRGWIGVFLKTNFTNRKFP